jgi:hypothetical protein
MTDLEPFVEASFDRMLPYRVVAADWADVLERADARRPRRRGFLLPQRSHRYLVAVLTLIALTVVVGAAAYALGHPIIKFNETPRATSRTVVNFFGRIAIGVPTGTPSGRWPPRVLPHQARLISDVRINGRDYPLWIAPIQDGGFCYAWKDSGVGDCRPAHQRRSLSVSGLATPSRGSERLNTIGGWFTQAHVARIVLTYADGQSSDIPFVWVTAPINSGFFLYGIPQAHRRVGHQATRIALLDSSGAVITSQPVMGIMPPAPRLPYRLVRHRLVGYPPLMVPAPAEWTKRQQLFDWRTDSGIRLGLWTAPTRDGGTCYWSNLATGCATTPPNWPKLKRGHGYVALCCTIARNVTRLELSFQDGDHVTFRPKHGYLIWPIRRRHYPPGHRLDQLVAYNAAGTEVGVVSGHPEVRALYPCAKPKNYGYGVIMCP